MGEGRKTEKEDGRIRPPDHVRSHAIHGRSGIRQVIAQKELDFLLPKNRQPKDSRLYIDFPFFLSPFLIFHFSVRSWAFRRLSVYLALLRIL